MVTLTLSGREKSVLRRLAEDPTSVEALVEAVEYDHSELTERLTAMEENGLVRQGDDDSYALTESGRRVLEAPATGEADSRIDVPDRVQAAIDALGLRADREEAVYNAFAFLRYWGEATENEIVDGIYSENPIDYGSVDDWWQTFMRDALASLPEVEEPGAGERTWRYAGTPEIETETEDGRQLFSPETDSFGSVKHAFEALDLPADRQAAVHAVFAALQERETAAETDLKSEAFEQADAGYSSADEWWVECVEPVLAELPGVEQAEDGTWRYTGTDSSQYLPDAQSEADESESSSDGAEATDGPTTKVPDERAAEATDEQAVEATGEPATEATDEPAADDVCPVCHEPYSESVFIEAGETRLSGWSIPTCVKATPADTPTGTDLTLYYHSGDDTE